MASSDPFHMYIYNLPYAERQKLCRVLDRHNAWEELGGSFMSYDVSTLHRIGQAVLRSRSPTDELLSLWGTHNHTVKELFILLSRMQHYEAMSVLKPLVSPEYHALIYEGEENFSKLVPGQTEKRSIPDSNLLQKVHNVLPKGAENLDCNFNCALKGRNNYGKMLFDPPEKIALPEEKIINAPSTSGADKIRKMSNELNAVSESLTPQISYPELEAATNGWHRASVLGKGGFGTVYRGVWKNTEVAVKRLEVQRKGDHDENWRTQREQSLRELKYLNSCRHDNILPIYGYSMGGLFDCLVYQFMQNGSLEDRLQCRESSKPLTWDQRHKIAVGVARGIQYLHTVGEKPLVHGDIKSANILLDPCLVPKIGDFGLAREGPLSQYTHMTVSRVHGTKPYLPDEFLRSKKFSTKVDTYSFGIVLFELATGLRAYDESRKVKCLKDELEMLSNENICQLRDSRAGPEDGFSYVPLVALGKCCVSSKPKDRPEMVLVLQKLDTIAKEREKAKDAHVLARQNSLSPSTPYQLQVMHDHLSQQRRSISVSPGGGLTLETDNRATILRTPSPLPVRVLPPSPNLTDLLPPTHDLPEGDDLPLISELGIKSETSE